MYLKRSLVLPVCAAGCVLCCSVSSCIADDLPKKPWYVNLGGFLLTDPVVTSQSAAGSFTLKYNFNSRGSRRQNEDGVALFGAFATAQVAGIGIDNSISMGGVLYEHTWGFGSLYYAISAGYLYTQASNFGAGGSASDFAAGSRFGVYFDRKQTIGLEMSYLSGNRPANTGLSLGLVGRF